MRIAILGIKKLPASGGADRVVEKILENAPTENEYFVYLLRERVIAIPPRRDIHYINISSVRGKHLRPFVYFFRCALHCLFRGSYDLIHIHNSDFGLFSSLVTLRYKSNIIGTFHGNPYLRQKWGFIAKKYLKVSEYVFLKSCDVLTSVSIRDHAYGKQIHYIPNGISAENQPMEGERFDYSRYGLSNGNYILFAAGRLDPTKGLHHLITAYKNGGIQKKLLVISDFGHDRQYSKKIDAMVHDNTDIILHKNLVTESVLRDCMKNSEFFVFPSEVEAMSMVLLEAIASGRPVVCSDIRENIAIVGRNYPLLFSSGNAADLADKMKIVLSDAIDHTVLDEYSKNIIRQYDWKIIVGKYFELFGKIK